MKYFKNDDEKNSEDKEISLDFALKEIDKESTNKGNFISFTNENEETIQFIREGEDDWNLDFPTPEKEYAALQDLGLTTEKVKEIVKVFSLNQDWRFLCKLTPIANYIDLTTKLCPFFKTNCKGNQCVMCRDGQCLIVNYLEPSDWEEVPSGKEQNEDAKTSFPEWLKTATPESLAKEMLEFKNEQFPKDEEVQFSTLSNLFWSNKGVERYCLPADIQLKVLQAENQFKKEREEKRKIMYDELVKEILGNKKKYGIEGKTGKAGHTVTMKQISSILLDMGKPDILSYDLHPRINRELLRD